MMRSQFDKELNVIGGDLQVGGPFELIPGCHPETQRIVWMVGQGDDVCASGTWRAYSETRWDDSDGIARAWVDGPAWAVAVTVALSREGAHTYTWRDEVTLVCA